MRLLALAAVLMLCASATSAAKNVDWSKVDAALDNAIQNITFPGCVAVVMDSTGVLYSKAHGHFTYGINPPYPGGVNPPMTLSTRFDMASCTKVLSATTGAALLYQWGALELDMRIADQQLLGPQFAQNGKGEITVRNVLLHNAGYKPDPVPNYWDKRFGCPETAKPQPQENYSCREQIWQAFLAAPLDNPPNHVYVYSDSSMITLMFVIGKIAQSKGFIRDSDVLSGCMVDPAHPSNPPTEAAIYQCYYEAFMRKYVFGALKLQTTQFLPPQSVWGQCAPAENDTLYAGKTIQGQVSDGNTYAMGGISGHAGLFTTALEAAQIMREWMFPSGVLFNSTTTKLWIKEYNQTQSSRALGWNTNDPNAYDQGWNLSCGLKLSPQTFMHTGYTGTEVCGDPNFPTGPLVTVLLTNRVYPSDKPGSGAIHDVRQRFNDAVYDALTAAAGLEQS